MIEKDTTFIYHHGLGSYLGSKKLSTADQEVKMIDLGNVNPHLEYEIEMKQINFNNLAGRYFNQKNKFGMFIEDYEEIAETIFFNVATRLLDLNPSKIKISITESPSLFFSLNINSGYQLRFEIFINDQNNMVVYSLYKEDELIARNSSHDFEELIDEITDEIGLKQLETSITEKHITTFADSTEFSL